MTISVVGSRMDFRLNIVTDGDKCSIIMQDSDGVFIKQGKISIEGKINPETKGKIAETIERYDKDGKLVEKITREKKSQDDTTIVSGMLTVNPAWDTQENVLFHGETGGSVKIRH